MKVPTCRAGQGPHQDPPCGHPDPRPPVYDSLLWQPQQTETHGQVPARWPSVSQGPGPVPACPQGAPAGPLAPESFRQGHSPLLGTRAPLPLVTARPPSHDPGCSLCSPCGPAWCAASPPQGCEHLRPVTSAVSSAHCQVPGRHTTLGGVSPSQGRGRSLTRALKTRLPSRDAGQNCPESRTGHVPSEDWAW